jgi:Tol biopolymer transport system component/tRNA A-37 threonylcarbamoyl transferase component Bud32
MTLESRSRLGPYEIVASVGSGGMGEVYRARDPRIGRDVAIKVLPVGYSADEERLRRFEQEARAIGALNHPNIVSIFDIGTHDGAPYVVMELLEGETLRDALGAPHLSIRKNSDEKSVAPPLPMRRSLAYAKEIATGLAAAHEKGIVHRDLKPENIFITRDGRVKILDFGLAKLAAPRESETTAIRVDGDTTPGTVLGTVGYMSPEQVRGHHVDHRSDLFAVGAIFYELFTGRRAFKRDSAADTMSAILHEDPPDLTELAHPVSPGLDRIIRHCLEKSPEQRFQSARDLAFDLESLSSDSSSPLARTSSAAASTRRRLFRVAGVIVLLSLFGVTAWLAYRAGAARAEGGAKRDFQQLTRDSGLEYEGSISMDGKLAAFVGGKAGASDVFVQRVDGGNAINVTKDCPLDDRQPSFSPDGSQIAFRSEREGGGVFVMGATGESVRRLSDFGYNPSWSPDGKRVVVATAPIDILPLNRPVRSTLWIIDVRSGAKRQIVEQDAVQPSWSRQGNRIAFWGLIGDSGQRDLFTVAADAPKPAESIVKVTDDAAIDWNPVWAPDGKSLLFGSDRDGTLNLWRVAIDERTGIVKGDPEPLSLPARYSGNFSIAADGNLLFSDHELSDSILRREIDASGNVGAPEPILSGSFPIFSVEVSPDGEWLAISNLGRQEDLFVMKRDGSEMRQLTNDPERDRGPAWAADGKWLYFYSQRGAPRYEPWRIRVDGSGLEHVLQTSGESQWFPRPSPDATRMVMGNEKGVTIYDLRAPKTPPKHLKNPPEGVFNLARWSPDSRRLTMSIRDTDRTVALGVLDLATDGLELFPLAATDPQWSRDGKSIYFADEQERFGKLDLATKKVKWMDVTFDRDTPTAGRRRFILSPDERAVYHFETRREGDLWLMRVGE